MNRYPWADRLSTNSGVVMIMALIAVTIISVVVLELTGDSRLEFQLSENYATALKCENIARSGVQFAIYALKNDQPEVDSLQEDWSLDFSSALSAILITEGVLSLSIVDESSKFNLNALVKDRLKEKEAARPRLVDAIKKLCELSKQDYLFVDAAIDWIDSDDDEYVPDQMVGGGAESSYYLSLTPAYEAKNELFSTTEEALLLKGMHNDIWYGVPADPENSVDAKPAMRQFLTIFGNEKLNINTASAAAIEALHLDITPELANAIIGARSNSDFSDINKLKDDSLIPKKIHDQIKHLIDVKSAGYFSVTSTGKIDNITKTIEAILHREDNRIDIVYWRES